jgi:type VI secretion system secreted protein VgrG
MSAIIDAATYAAQSAIEAALSGLSQHNRLLRLSLPTGTGLAPNTLLAERLTGTECVAPATSGTPGFAFELLAVSTDATLDLGALLGQPVLIELLTPAGTSALRPLHAHITAAGLLGSDGGLARYRLSLAPWLALLGHRQDSYIFQNQSVPEVIDELLADWQGQGALTPAWRWELSDPSAYPRRSLTTQFDETDLAFLERLLNEEGLFYWFEHTRDQHTLVIADHNGAFKPGAQPDIRYTSSASASLKEDSLTRWQAAQAKA